MLFTKRFRLSVATLGVVPGQPKSTLSGLVQPLGGQCSLDVLITERKDAIGRVIIVGWTDHSFHSLVIGIREMDIPAPSLSTDREDGSQVGEIGRSSDG